MMPGILDRRLRSTRSRMAALLAVVLLSSSLVAAHGPVAGDHMGGAMGKAMTICLAVMQGAVVVYGTRRVMRKRIRRAPIRQPAHQAPHLASVVSTDPPPGTARAGPERLQVFRL